jgi:hypothetical protein
MNPHTPKWAPTLGVETRWTSKFSKKNCRGQNQLVWRVIYIIGNLLKRRCSHDSFGHLKHKLLPKERSKVKLAVWLSTTKSQESTQFTCVQVACEIPLKSSRQGLQLCFRPHLNQRSAHKVIGPQSGESPNFGNFRTPIWESLDKMPFGCGPRGEA